MNTYDTEESDEETNGGRFSSDIGISNFNPYYILNLTKATF